MAFGNFAIIMPMEREVGSKHFAVGRSVYGLKFFIVVILFMNQRFVYLLSFRCEFIMSLSKDTLVRCVILFNTVKSTRQTKAPKIPGL